MALTAMISVNLKGTTPAQRSAFDAHMDGQDWIKVPNLDDAWAGDFPNTEAAQKQAVHEQAVHAVTGAAQAAGLRHVHAAVHVGTEIPTLFTAP